jgi:hypothetical protein
MDLNGNRREHIENVWEKNNTQNIQTSDQKYGGQDIMKI